MLADKLVVVGMAPNPEPLNPVFNVVPKRPIVPAYADGPQRPNPLEVKRGMARVGLQELVVLVRKLADALREVGVLRPKGRRSKMPQISFDLADL